MLFNLLFNCRQEVTSLSSGAFSLVYLLLNISDFRSIAHAQIMTHREKNVNIVNLTILLNKKSPSSQIVEDKQMLVSIVQRGSFT